MWRNVEIFEEMPELPWFVFSALSDGGHQVLTWLGLSHLAEFVKCRGSPEVQLRRYYYGEPCKGLEGSPRPLGVAQAQGDHCLPSPTPLLPVVADDASFTFALGMAPGPVTKVCGTGQEASVVDNAGICCVGQIKLFRISACWVSDCISRGLLRSREAVLPTFSG